jgi:hypothetical protein
MSESAHDRVRGAKEEKEFNRGTYLQLETGVSRLLEDDISRAAGRQTRSHVACWRVNRNMRHAVNASNQRE